MEKSSLFEYIDQATEKAKSLRMNRLTRFHIGDVVYPLYQTWFPTIWGTIVEINPAICKISVNLNGVIRQYDPEELVLTSPELKPDSTYNQEREKIQKKAEKEVTASFKKRASSLDLEEEEEKDKNYVLIFTLFLTWKKETEKLATHPEEGLEEGYLSFLKDTLNLMLLADQEGSKGNFSEFFSFAVDALYAFQTAYSYGHNHLPVEVEQDLSLARTKAEEFKRALDLDL